MHAEGKLARRQTQTLPGRMPDRPEGVCFGNDLVRVLEPADDVEQGGGWDGCGLGFVSEGERCTEARQCVALKVGEAVVVVRQVSADRLSTPPSTHAET